MATRTTHRSTAGRKLYAVRDKSGRFKDVQTYKRAHAQDLRTRSREECALKVGLLIDAARAFTAAFGQGWWDKDTKKGLIYKLCKASIDADRAIAKAVKARARKRA